jgi:hypothetical protein
VKVMCGRDLMDLDGRTVIHSAAPIPPPGEDIELPHVCDACARR